MLPRAALLQLWTAAAWHRPRCSTHSKSCFAPLGPVGVTSIPAH
jgi:hypothetical protein